MVGDAAVRLHPDIRFYLAKALAEEGRKGVSAAVIARWGEDPASVTPDDAGCCDLFAERLRALGFAIEFIDRNGVTNLWARRGASAPSGSPR